MIARSALLLGAVAAAALLAPAARAATYTFADAPSLAVTDAWESAYDPAPFAGADFTRQVGGEVRATLDLVGPGPYANIQGYGMLGALTVNPGLLAGNVVGLWFELDARHVSGNGGQGVGLVIEQGGRYYGNQPGQILSSTTWQHFVGGSFGALLTAANFNAPGFAFGSPAPLGGAAPLDLTQTFTVGYKAAISGMGTLTNTKEYANLRVYVVTDGPDGHDVPEPASVALAALGGAGLLGARRARRA